MSQQAEIGFFPLDFLFVCVSQNRGDPGMSVLDVVDRVVHGLACGELDIELHLRVR